MTPWATGDITGQVLPLMYYLVFCLMASSIEVSWRDKRQATKDLAKYPVTSLQVLVTKKYGKRDTTAENIVFSLTNKEETTPTKGIATFMAFVLPFIMACCHIAISVGFSIG